MSTATSLPHSLPEVLDYLVLGAGPGGLQVATYLEAAGARYVVLDRGLRPGSFFEKYPRHGRLISANKAIDRRRIGESHLRFDWHSLLSARPDRDLRFSSISHEYFPSPSALVTYLAKWSEHLALNIRLETDIVSIVKIGSGFLLTSALGEVFAARTLIVAAGMAAEYVAEIPGIQHATSYGTMSLDAKEFTGKTVLIIGKGNSAFETANHLVSTAQSIHLVSPTTLRLAWNTHFAGHLRALNASFIDTYLLKLGNAVLDARVLDIERRHQRLRVRLRYVKGGGEEQTLDYDKVICCTGFRFDASCFDEACLPHLSRGGRLPEQTPAWESVNVPGMFFAGTLTQDRDFQGASSAFIEGLRFNARALARFLLAGKSLERRPGQTYRGADAITRGMLRRLNANAGLWDQFGFLCDVYTRLRGDVIRRTEEVPVAHAHQTYGRIGCAYLLVSFEFGPPDPCGDAIRVDRPAQSDLEHAHMSPFAHPVVRLCQRGDVLEEFHLPENLESVWRDPTVHAAPLGGFLARALAAL